MILAPQTEHERIEIHVLPADMDMAEVSALLRRWLEAAPQVSALPQEYVAGFFAELSALVARRKEAVLKS